MNTPGSSFRSHSLNSRIARLSTTKHSLSMLKNSGIIKKDSAASSKTKKGFKQIEQYLIKKRTISNLSTSMVVDAHLIDRDDDGIHVRIYRVYPRKDTFYECIAEDLDLRAICLFDEIEPNKELKEKKLFTKQFQIGCECKGVIIKVDYHTLEIYISFSVQSPHPYHTPLGLSKGLKNKSPKLQLSKPKAVYSPYYQHRYDSSSNQNRSNMSCSTPTSPFQQTLMFKPSITRSSSTNSNYSVHSNNAYFVPSKLSKHNKIAQSPLYAAFESQNKEIINFPIMKKNEFDLLAHQNNDNNNENENEWDSEYKHKQNKLWIDKIRNHELFRNPSGVDMMRDAFGICDYSSMLFRKKNICKDLLTRMKKNERAKHHQNNEESECKIADAEIKNIEFDKDYLRKEQAFLASRSALESGVEHAKNGRLEKAVKHYEVSLDWDPECSDALVAKAAALCHLNRLEEAKNCIDFALEIDADTPNALKYLNVILEKQKNTKIKACFPPNE